MLDTFKLFKHYYLHPTPNEDKQTEWPTTRYVYDIYLQTTQDMGLEQATKSAFRTSLKLAGHKFATTGGSRRVNVYLTSPARAMVNKKRDLHAFQGEIISTKMNIGPQQEWPTTTEVYDAYRAHISGTWDLPYSRRAFTKLLKDLNHTQVISNGAFRVNCIILTQSEL